MMAHIHYTIYNIHYILPTAIIIKMDSLVLFTIYVHLLLLDVFTCRLCRCSTLATANLPLQAPLGECTQSWSGAGES